MLYLLVTAITRQSQSDTSTKGLKILNSTLDSKIYEGGERTEVMKLLLSQKGLLLCFLEAPEGGVQTGRENYDIFIKQQFLRPSGSVPVAQEVFTYF